MKDAAKIYGEALYELAHSESLDGELLPQLRGAAELLAAASEYQYILSSPAISKAERTGLLDQAFAGQVHPYVLNFMKILCEAGAIRLLPSCLRSYERRYNQDNNILKARAVTAVEMTQEQQEALRQKLSTATENGSIDLPNRPGLPGRRPRGNGRPAAGRYRPQTSGGYERSAVESSILISRKRVRKLWN